MIFSIIEEKDARICVRFIWLRMRMRADFCEYGKEHSVLRDKWEISSTGMLLSASAARA